VNRAAIYGIIYVAIVLAMTVLFFQRRELT